MKRNKQTHHSVTVKIARAALVKGVSTSVKPELTGYDVLVEIQRCGHETAMVCPYGFADAGLVGDERGL